MKAHRNGAPETCAANLLRIVRGEVPYDRVRGRDPALIDRPGNIDESIADIEWLLETYEPRVSIESAEAIAEAVAAGDFETVVNITMQEEEAAE